MQRIGELLELVGLTGRERERVEGYSRGMRQRLHIARGLLHRPEVLFLDEPSIGIDPVGARELRDTVASLVSQGTTVLLTTHYMFEADELCDRIAVIAGGADRRAGNARRSSSPGSADGHVVEIEVFGSADQHLDVVRAIPGVQSVMIEESGHAQMLVVRTEANARGDTAGSGLPGGCPHSVASPPASPPWKTPTSSSCAMWAAREQHVSIT